MKLHKLIALLAFTGAVHAGTDTSKTAVTTAPEESPWHFRVAPYGWVTAIEGDVGIGQLSAPVDISMSDTLDTLDMAYMGIIEAGYGKWSFGVDVIYAKTSQDIDGAGFLFKSFRYEQKQWIITPVISYRVIETDRYHMDFFTGARITILEAELTGRFARGGEIVGSRDKDWIDPIVGIRGQAELTDKLFFRYNGDIGGFGVNSDLIWQAFVGLGYHCTENVSVALGYRGLGIDYSDDGFSLDTVTHGPVVGLEVRF
jgi:opacity protein-like surface antigen